MLVIVFVLLVVCVKCPVQWMLPIAAWYQTLCIQVSKFSVINTLGLEFSGILNLGPSALTSVVQVWSLVEGQGLPGLFIMVLKGVKAKHTKTKVKHDMKWKVDGQYSIRHVTKKIMEHLHPLTHTEINSQSILKKREYRRLTLWAKETKSDISQLKVELTNTQSRKLSLSRVPTGECSKENGQQFNLHGETRKSEEKRGERKKRKEMGGRGS